MRSLWQQQSFYFTSDIAIVGAGLTGLLTAIKLKQSNSSLKVRVLEGGLYPEGASAKNAGFACFGSVSEILDDIRGEGESKAFKRVIERYRGLKLIFETVKPELVDVVSNGGVEVFTAAEKSILDESLEAMDHINNSLAPELGFSPFSRTAREFGLNSLSQSILIKGESTLNSGKLLKALIQKATDLGVEINFGAKVKSLERNGSNWQLHTDRVEFSAHKVLLATNGFTSLLRPQIPIIPARGQIVLTSKIPNLKIDRSFHLHQGYFYFRNFEGAIMLGGGRHLDRDNEVSTSQLTSPYIQQELEKVLKEVILPHQEFTIVQRWAGTMAFGPNNEKEAIVEKQEDGLFVAARLGGMGVAMSSLVADKAKNLILS